MMSDDGRMSTRRAAQIERVAALTVARGMTMDQVAVEIGICRATVERIHTTNLYDECVQRQMDLLRGSDTIAMAWRGLLDLARNGPAAQRLRACAIILDRLEGVPRTSASVEITTPESEPMAFAHLTPRELADLIERRESEDADA